MNVRGGTIQEENTFLSRYQRKANRLTASVIDVFRKAHSATGIAEQYNVSVSTALHTFDLISYQPKELPEVLSIDEFKGNAGAEVSNDSYRPEKEKDTGYFAKSL